MGWGGFRPGSGRQPGRTSDRTYDRLSGFEIQATRSLRHRVPKDVSPELGRLADHAFKRIVDVLDEKVSPDHSSEVLKAAVLIRDEICGPITKKVELKVGLAEMIAQATDEPEDPYQIVDADMDMTPLLESGEADVLSLDPEDRERRSQDVVSVRVDEVASSD